MARIVLLLLVTILGAVLAAVLAVAPTPMANTDEANLKPDREVVVFDKETVKESTTDTGRTGATVAASVQGASRDVGSGKVASSVAPGTVLERIAPVAPPVEAQESTPGNSLPADAQKRWRVVFNSVIKAAGVFDLNGMSIVLPGIDVVTADEICTTGGGRVWPCGTAARTAFRAYVRNRALNCRLPVSRQDKAIVAECLLQGVDPAEWLVAQGWARAATGGPFGELAKQAKDKAHGIFGNPPTGVGDSSGATEVFVPEALFDANSPR